MSFLARLFRRFRHPAGFVGKDLEGNRFFEYPSVSDDPRRTKRVVKYARGTEMLDYVSGQRRLAVQWTSWLTHTRPHPPTLEELQGDLQRQRRILMNVAIIEAREREQAAQIALQEQERNIPEVQAPPSRAAGPAHNQPTVGAAPIRGSVMQDGEPSTTSSTSPASGEPGPSSPWKPPPKDEPHSWKPRASVRRGS